MSCFSLAAFKLFLLGIWWFDFNRCVKSGLVCLLGVLRGSWMCMSFTKFGKFLFFLKCLSLPFSYCRTPVCAANLSHAHSSPKLRLCCCFFVLAVVLLGASFSSGFSCPGCRLASPLSSAHISCRSSLVFLVSPAVWCQLLWSAISQPDFRIEYPSEVILQVQSYISYWFCFVVCEFWGHLPVSPVLGLLPG